MSYVVADLFNKPPDYAALAANSEAQRQSLINLGTNEINAVFGGGTAPFYNQLPKGTAFDPTQSYAQFGNKGFAPYYSPTAGGGGFKPYGGGGNVPTKGSKFNKTTGLIGSQVVNPVDPGMGFILGGLLGGLFSKGPTPMQQFQSKDKSGKLYTQTNPTFQGFTPDFYNQRAQAYVDYALPQLAEQFRGTRNQIGFGLANRGLRGSGAARQQYSDLARTNAEATQQISDTGRSQAQALQQQVEAQKNQLINQLYQSADPASAAQSAISSAAGFQAPSTFAPLANQFSGLINQYYASQILNPKQTLYSPQATYGGGLNVGALGPTSYSVGGNP